LTSKKREQLKEEKLTFSVLRKKLKEFFFSFMEKIPSAALFYANVDFKPSAKDMRRKENFSHFHYL
jgi:hypothetical protein